MHHDNVSSHTAAKIKDFLRENNISLLPHPLYSPDLAPLGFWVFPKLKKQLSNKKFDRIQDLSRTINQTLQAYPEDWYGDCMKQWIARLERCIAEEGLYVERLR